VSWIRSSSKDVVAYDIYRKKSEDDQWTRIKAIKASEADTYELIDRNTPKDVSLIYTVVAVDDARKESPQASPVMTKIVIPELRPAVTWGNSIRVDRQNLLLKWEYGEAEVRAFKIYKSVGDDVPVLYKTLKADERKFQDIAREGIKCSYQMLALFLDGRQSVLSEKLNFN
jgi:hypothetical protein